MKVIPQIPLTGRKGAELFTQDADHPEKQVPATSFAAFKLAAILAQQHGEKGEVAIIIRRKMDKVLDKFDAANGAENIELEDDSYAILCPTVFALVKSWGHHATHVLDGLNDALRAANGLPPLLEPRDDLDRLAK